MVGDQLAGHVGPDGSQRLDVEVRTAEEADHDRLQHGVLLLGAAVARVDGTLEDAGNGLGQGFSDGSRHSARYPDSGRWSTGRASSAACVSARSFAALAFVHGLHRATGISWPSAIRSSARCCGAGMCSAHGSRSPSASSAVWTVKSDGVHLVELVPRRAGTTPARRAAPRAVRGDDGRATDPRRVDEHLALAVVLDERGRRERRVEALGAHGDRARTAAAESSGGARSSIGTKMCRPLAPLVLSAPVEPDVVERLAHQVRDRRCRRRSRSQARARRDRPGCRRRGLRR